MKAGEDKDGLVRFQAAGEQPGFAEGPRRRLPFQSGGNFRGGNCLKMKIASPGRQLESRKVEILHKLVWPRQSVVSQPWQ